MLTLYNFLYYYYQRCTCFGRFSTDHQELIKLSVQSGVLPCFPAVYSWCGWVGHIHTSGRQQESMTIPKAARTVL